MSVYRNRTSVIDYTVGGGNYCVHNIYVFYCKKATIKNSYVCHYVALLSCLYVHYRVSKTVMYITMWLYCIVTNVTMWLYCLERVSLYIVPHVVGAQLYRLSTVDAHTDVLKLIHGKII